MTLPKPPGTRIPYEYLGGRNTEERSKDSRVLEKDTGIKRELGNLRTPGRDTEGEVEDFPYVSESLQESS